MCSQDCGLDCVSGRCQLVRGAGFERGFGLHKAAVEEMKGSLRKTHVTGIVRDHAEGGTVPMELPEQLHDLQTISGVQVAGWFVGQQHAGTANNRPRHRDALLLPAGQLKGARVSTASVRKTLLTPSRRITGSGIACPCGRAIRSESGRCAAADPAGKG